MVTTNAESIEGEGGRERTIGFLQPYIRAFVDAGGPYSDAGLPATGIGTLRRCLQDITANVITEDECRAAGAWASTADQKTRLSIADGQGTPLFSCAGAKVSLRNLPEAVGRIRELLSPNTTSTQILKDIDHSIDEAKRAGNKPELLRLLQVKLDLLRKRTGISSAETSVAPPPPVLALVPTTEETSVATAVSSNVAREPAPVARSGWNEAWGSSRMDAAMRRGHEDYHESAFGYLRDLPLKCSESPEQDGDAPLLPVAECLAAELLLTTLGQVAILLRACESPIERMLFTALLLSAINRAPRMTIVLPDRRRIFGPTCADHRLEIRNQESVCQGKYRLDIVLRAEVSPGKSLMWAIEADGHEHHEKTKEQAARDKSRDRELQRAGFRVYHYTGSEVWADAEHVAWCLIDEIVQAVEERRKELAPPVDKPPCAGKAGA